MSETKTEPVVGQVVFNPQSADERRQEIDYRVMTALGQRDIMRGEYVRGLTDAFYFAFFLFMIGYIAYAYFFQEDK